MLLGPYGEMTGHSGVRYGAIINENGDLRKRERLNVPGYRYSCKDIDDSVKYFKNILIS